jgi:hypothetical protein
LAFPFESQHGFVHGVRVLCHFSSPYGLINGASDAGSLRCFPGYR